MRVVRRGVRTTIDGLEPRNTLKAIELKNLSIPNARATLLLAAFLVVTGLANGLYAARGIEPSPITIWLYVIGLVHILWYWIHSDCQRLGINEPLDLGFFLMAGWPVAYPYYLVKTRGWGRGLLMVAGMIGLIVGWYVLGIVTALVARLIMLMANMRS